MYLSFLFQYLSTPESQSRRADLIRYIVGVVHPCNEVLCSDIIPRWAIIGWLLTSCQVILDFALRHYILATRMELVYKAKLAKIQSKICFRIALICTLFICFSSLLAYRALHFAFLPFLPFCQSRTFCLFAFFAFAFHAQIMSFCFCC